MGSEIEEVRSSSSGRDGDDLFEITAERDQSIRGSREEIETVDSRSSLFSYDFHNDGDHGVVVYVAVGSGTKSDEEASMDALLWTLGHAADPPSSSLIFLVHVFPETKFIPSPLGMIPISKVNPEQKENHRAQERSKRRQFLQKFLDVCSASKVKVDTILIESDAEAKAILDLIPICNIRKLVLGTSKENRRKMKSKRGGRTADQILQNAPEFCDIKIICGGKEVAMDQQMFESPSPSPKASSDSSRSIHGQSQIQNQNDSFGCICFKAKVLQ